MKWGSPPIGGIKEFGVHCCGDDFSSAPSRAIQAGMNIAGQIGAGIAGGPNLVAMLNTPTKKNGGSLDL